MSFATASSSTVGEYLREVGLFSEEQVDAILERSSEMDGGITELVLQLGFAREEEYLEKLAAVVGVPFLRLAGEEIDTGLLPAVPTKAVFQYNVIPVREERGCLLVATDEPFNGGMLDALRLASGMRVRLALSPANDIAAAAKRYYGVGADTLDRMMQDDDRIDVDPTDDLFKAEISDLDQEASIVRFVNQVIWEAYKERSTDIHLEPMEDELRIRYRVDGRLHQTPLPPQLTRFQAAIISRIKVMANMDIAEKRLPQDGRIGLRIKGEDIDIRVSTMPTAYGESVSLRLLMKGGEMISLEELGLLPRDMEIINRYIHRPNGIILVTGPTGSGKSTSLYSYLHEINSIDQRIITVEDPIEYEMEGINQINVRSDIGLTFATALRHILRQDPDVIMIGEIRDFETAEIAIRASLTGHLVFSTLHTNDASGAITRLIDMGVEPFLVASSVKAVVAQRLVRRLCKDCRVPTQPDVTFLKSMAFPLERLEKEPVYEATGCDACRHTGYKGRMGIYEVLSISESIEPLIVERRSAGDIKTQGLKEGMRTLRDDGWEKVLRGITTIDEVIRVSEETE